MDEGKRVNLAVAHQEGIEVPEIVTTHLRPRDMNLHLQYGTSLLLRRDMKPRHEMIDEALMGGTMTEEVR